MNPEAYKVSRKIKRRAKLAVIGSAFHVPIAAQNSTVGHFAHGIPEADSKPGDVFRKFEDLLV